VKLLHRAVHEAKLHTTSSGTAHTVSSTPHCPQNVCWRLEFGHVFRRMGRAAKLLRPCPSHCHHNGYTNMWGCCSLASVDYTDSSSSEEWDRCCTGKIDPGAYSRWHTTVCTRHTRGSIAVEEGWILGHYTSHHGMDTSIKCKHCGMDPSITCKYHGMDPSITCKHCGMDPSEVNITRLIHHTWTALCGAITDTM
jgi:hypothetical protein